MKLQVIGSSSKGNCYILSNESEALVIEAGVRFAEVNKALDYNVAKVAACLVSHEHGDHAGYVGDFLKMRIPVYSTDGTAKAHAGNRYMNIIQPSKVFSVGNFTVLAVGVTHDVPCLAFVIKHPDMGKLLFATDTPYIPFVVPALNNIMIEANYDKALLDSNVEGGVIDKSHRDRVVLNHMSLTTCIETLCKMDLSRVNNIVLLHLSNDNAHGSTFARKASETLLKDVSVAKKGLVIEHFGRTPF